MRSDVILIPGRFAGRSPKVALAIIALAIAIKMGWVGPENSPPECETRHPGHAAYVADHPGECE